MRKRSWDGGGSAFPQSKIQNQKSKIARQGFTLTELLVVIAIIGVLAALITSAAMNAVASARRARIVLEIKNLSTALENFKNERGMYPPNGMNPDDSPGPLPPAGSPAAYVQSDIDRAFKKAFPKSQEPPGLIGALVGLPGGSVLSSDPLLYGMRANEALFFWLGGFSDDPQFPISGPGGPAYDPDEGEVFENRRGYEFDFARLGPRDEDGDLDYDNVRSLTYQVRMNGVLQNRRINFWYFHPEGSEQPYVYFDTSRHKPSQIDMWATLPDPVAGVPAIFAFKQLRTGLKEATGRPQDLAYVNQGKFQILHAGLDDVWGEDLALSGSAPRVEDSTDVALLFPDGPFIGDAADTLSNFADGAIEDEQPE